MQPEEGASSADNDHPGATLKRLRQAQELTLRDLATMAEVDYSMLSKVERGLVNPSRRWLKAVGDALGYNLGSAA